MKIHLGRMEDVKHGAFVNFANQVFAYGNIIESATQEEILLSCCPEIYCGMLVGVETMQSNEVVIVRNVRRFCDYTGYLDTFRFSHDCYSDWPEPFTVITMDATTHHHFSREKQLRDLRKAWLGFSSSIDSVISSGQWGCGVFGGDNSLKFLQQLIAAQLAGCKEIHFSAFRNESLQDQVKELLTLVSAKPISLIIQLSLAYDEMRNDWSHSFQDFLRERLSRTDPLEGLSEEENERRKPLLRAKRLFDEAGKLESEGDMNQAIKLYKQAFSLDPSLESQ